MYGAGGRRSICGHIVGKCPLYMRRNYTVNVISRHFISVTAGVAAFDTFQSHPISGWYAVDGSEETCTHPIIGDNPFWAADFAGERDIGHIQILTRNYPSKSSQTLSSQWIL